MSDVLRAGSGRFVVYEGGWGPTVPQEVVDEIIDQLGIELLTSPNGCGVWWTNFLVATLTACSRVCKAWLPRASKYVFHSLDPSRGSQSGIEALQQFLRMARASPRISSNVQALTIPVGLSEVDVTAVMRTFPRLMSLNWHQNQGAESERGRNMPSTGSEPTFLRSSLRHVSLNACSQTTIDFLDNFDHICTLELFVTRREPIAPMRSTPHQVRITTLNLDAYNLLLFNTNIAKFLAPTTLRKLVMWCRLDFYCIISDVNDCLRAVATEIEHFTFFINANDTNCTMFSEYL